MNRGSIFHGNKSYYIVSGTVAQWECVWGQSYGDLQLLAVVICWFVL